MWTIKLNLLLEIKVDDERTGFLNEIRQFNVGDQSQPKWLKLALWLNGTFLKGRSWEKGLEDSPVLKFICQLSVGTFDFFHLPLSKYYWDNYNEWPVYRVVFTRAMGIKKTPPRFLSGEEKNHMRVFNQYWSPIHNVSQGKRKRFLDNVDVKIFLWPW